MKREELVELQREHTLKMTQVEIPRELVLDYIVENVLSDDDFPERTTVAGLTVTQNGNLVEARSADGNWIYILGGENIGMDWGADLEILAQRRGLEISENYHFVFGLAPSDSSRPDFHCAVYRRSK